MPPATSDLGAELLNVVHQLKIDRDNWKAIAGQYKAAFEAQTARFRELQDICFAAQAELENEQSQNRRVTPSSDESSCGRSPTSDGSGSFEQQTFGTALIMPTTRSGLSWREMPTKSCSNPIFSRVQQLAQRCDHGSALLEIDRLLRGPLSEKGRIEGLLLRSNILKAMGPEHLYDALAACSEALEICDRTPGLKSILPKIQYQRGICLYQLRMLHQARDAFNAATCDELLVEKADIYRKSCEDELDLMDCIDRRSGFDNDRTMTNELLSQLDEPFHSKIRRTSIQLRQRAAAKTKRISLPQRWVAPKNKAVWTI